MSIKIMCVSSFVFLLDKINYTKIIFTKKLLSKINGRKIKTMVIFNSVFLLKKISYKKFTYICLERKI